MLNTLKDKETIIDLYMNQNLTVNEIARNLNYKYSQPVYNLLVKERNIYHR